MVYCIGETVLDIIFKNDLPVAAKPGGSMLNTAVSLGRAGIEVQLVSEFGTDRAGSLIGDFLSENNVGTDFTYRYADGMTTISLAFLSGKNEAEYDFYKRFPRERLKIAKPLFKPGDYVLYGSFFAIAKEVRAPFISLLSSARESGATLFYDPNFRNVHLGERDALMKNIRENIGFAGLMRGSNEDFLNIFATETGESAFREIKKFGCNRLIYTNNRKGLEVFDRESHFLFPVPEIEPVSTIGAGDSFNAGLIYAMTRGFKGWDRITGIATRFAADVCMTYDNYITKELLKELENDKMAG
jgi:fructokinase